jgi:hypothetical protein
MPTTKGKKKRFTAKQDRMASHVAKSMKKSGKSAKDAKSIGYATVNKNKAKKKKAAGKKKGAKKSSADSQGRNIETKTKPKRKAANRKSRNKGR